MDEIRVKNLEVFCHHGVYKEENVLGQKFLVNIVSKVDTRAAGKTDELELSVSYLPLCQKRNDKAERQTVRTSCRTPCRVYSFAVSTYKRSGD